MPAANASQPLPSFLATLFAVAFGINWLWEMLQMPAYADVPERSWRETVLLCTVASVGDVALTLAAYGAGALVTRRLRYGRGRSGGWKTYALMALSGVGVAITIEIAALAVGYWSYNERMLVLPLVNVGLLPFLQLTLLMPLSLWIAVRVMRAFANQKEEHESFW